MQIPKPHLLGLRPEDAASQLAAAGVTLSDRESRRLIAQRISREGARSALRHPLSKRLLLAIEQATDPGQLEIIERAEDPADGFVKYLFRSPDGALHEAVRIPLHKPGRYSVCLSSQVGCAMACEFCATGRLGLTRNLLAWEMVAAFLAVRDEAPGRTIGAVFMGQGEPFHNYDEVIQAARVLSHPCGAAIDARSITISTVGLVAAMRRYTREGHPYRLIVSLTSAVPERRARLLPVTGHNSLAELAAAVREHAIATGDRVTVAWVLLGGINHGADEVRALDQLLGGVGIKVNLIDVNESRADGFRRATESERQEFVDALQVLRVPIVRRYSGGSARHAACGMLAARRMDAEVPA